MTTTNGLPGPGVAPHGPLVCGAPAASAVDAIQIPVAAESPSTPQPTAHDLAALAVRATTDAPCSAASVSIAQAATAELQKVLPGATLQGPWSLENVTVLKEALKELPKPILRLWHGFSFSAPAGGGRGRGGPGAVEEEEEPGEPSLVALRVSRRQVEIRLAAFALPETAGHPALQLELAAALGRTAARRPGGTLAREFGRLSGWTIHTKAAPGVSAGPPRPVTGDWPGEQPLIVQQTRPLLGTGRSTPRPGGVQRAPGTAPLRGAQPEQGENSPAPRGGETVGRNSPPAKHNPAGLHPRAAEGGRVAGLRGEGPLAPMAAPAPARPGSPAGGQPGLPFESETSPVLGGGVIRVPAVGTFEFQHDGSGSFVGAAEAASDPAADLGESFRVYMAQPEMLLKSAPAKFLLLNVEAQRYSPQEVRAMAQRVGMDLSQELVALGASGRMSGATLTRVASHHGIQVDPEALRSLEQRVLMQGGTLETLLERLSLDLAARGPGSARDVRQAEVLLAEHHRLLGHMTPVREPERFGLPAGQRVFRWLSGTVERLTGSSGTASALLDVQTQFHRLPLAVQLRVSPEMALGPAWVRLSASERAVLREPQALQAFVAKAAETSDEVAYVPQRLNASEKRRLAVQTLVDGLLDTGSAGAVWRTRLGASGEALGRRALVLPDAVGALREMIAVNGDSVMDLLGKEATAGLASKQTLAALRQIMNDPAMKDALQVLRRGSLGAEGLRAAVLRFTLEQGRESADPVKVAQGLLRVIQQERELFVKRLDGGVLELVLSEAARQAREGQGRFVHAWLSDGDTALEESLGPWLAGALSPADRRLLLNRDYRRHVVEDAKHLFTTGQSLAEEARAFKVQTENIQAALELLLNPDHDFPREFAKDPVGALVRRGIFPHLPEPIQARLLDGARVPKVAQLVKAVEASLAPLLQRQLLQQQQRENLNAAIRTVNAANYRPILGILDMEDADMQRHVQTTLSSALSNGDKEIREGIIRYL